jgi:hypothetical protein
MTQEGLITYIISNLSLDIRNDLQGNQHICLLFGEEVISNVKFLEYDRV